MSNAMVRAYLDDPLLTTKETASELRVSKYTISSWLSQGKMRRTKVGGKTFVRKSELAKMIRDEE